MLILSNARINKPSREYVSAYIYLRFKDKLRTGKIVAVGGYTAQSMRTSFNSYMLKMHPKEPFLIEHFEISMISKCPPEKIVEGRIIEQH